MLKRKTQVMIAVIIGLCIMKILTLNINIINIDQIDKHIWKNISYEQNDSRSNGIRHLTTSIRIMSAYVKKNGILSSTKDQYIPSYTIHKRQNPPDKAMSINTSLTYTQAYTVSPKITQNKIIVIVLSERKDFKIRSVIRETWAKNHDNVLFVLGIPCFIPKLSRNPYTCTVRSAYTRQTSSEWNNSIQEEQNMILQENNKFRDIIYADTIDVYRHLPQKLKAAYNWVIQNTDAEWILKIDVDCVVRVGSLENYLSSQFDARKYSVIAAGINVNSVVGRSGKWAEYPEFTNTTYPPWPNGAGHVVSRPIAAYISKNRDTLFNAQGEDVALGIWMHGAPFQKSINWIKSDKFIPHSGNCKDTNALVVGHQISPSAMQHCFHFMDEVNLKKSHKQQSDSPTSNVKVTGSDRIMQRGYDASPIVIESYRLVIFTIPKSACTVIKQLARRIAGKSDWHVGGDKIPHDPSFNGLTYLSSFNIAEATSIMTSPNWTRVIFVRDPHVRILSAYLDKAVKHDYVKRHCGRTPGTFSDFLDLISTCKDPHWQSQRSFIDEKWWPFINFVGHVETAAHDMKLLLKGLGIWERYGKYNWGKKNESIFQQNHLQSRATSSTDNLLYYYTNYEWHKVTDLYSNDMEFKSLNYSMSALQNDGINELTPFGIIGILSAQGNTRLRETSRSTWINSIQGNIIIKFLLDRPSPETIYEESKYGDIIFLNSSTSGRAQKFGEKLARWLKYAHRQWPSVDFIAKMDDDVFLCPGILPYLRSKVDPKVYMGWKHSPTESALWNGKINRKERMDEMFVVLGSQLVHRLALRQYCDPGQPCARGLIDTNYGGTSLGAWLESYDDITAIPMNDNVIHYRAYGGLTCSDRYLFHKVSSSQMKVLYMATH